MDALKAIGFRTIELLPHKRWVRLAGADVLCFQSRQMDSALAVRSGAATILNLNDCDFGPRDWAELRRLIGRPDILLNQFSLAGFDGIESDLPKVAARILDDMVAAHRALGAKVTIPFASFAYFCCRDNALLNRHANRPGMVAGRFAKEQLDLAILAPGDTYAGGALDNAVTLGWWEGAYAAASDRPLTDPVAVSMDAILDVFERRCERLREYHGLWARLLPAIIVDADELGRLRFDFGKGTVTPTTHSADLTIAPDPLLFLLKWDFGSQTLGVSGRYRLLDQGWKWTAHKILFAMINAGIGLSVRRMFSRRQLAFFWRRRGDILPQTYYSLRRG